MKKLSVITICYNEPNLEATCESIVNQTWQDFEWIVIDGGSNKETLDIFEKYKHRINKFVSEPDKGIYDACNKGIKLAEGEYLNFMNAGDSFYNSKVLENVVATNSNEDILYGDINARYMDNTEKIIAFPEQLNEVFFFNDNINTQGIFAKRDLFLQYGNFDTQYKIASDYDRWLKFYSESKTFKHLPIVIANYKMDGISSVEKSQKLLLEEKSTIQSKYFSQSEINKFMDMCNAKNSFWEQIFSIKNNCNKSHKILTILGLHFYFRRGIK